MNAGRFCFTTAVCVAMLAAATPTTGQNLEQRSLNPQPEPPKQSTGRKAVKLKKSNPTELRGLNPQPEPPSRTTTKNKPAKLKKANPAELRGLNPQPEPPSK
jgi:hypothetical protein